MGGREEVGSEVEEEGGIPASCRRTQNPTLHLIQSLRRNQGRCSSGT